MSESHFVKLTRPGGYVSSDEAAQELWVNTTLLETMARVGHRTRLTFRGGPAWATETPEQILELVAVSPLRVRAALLNLTCAGCHTMITDPVTGCLDCALARAENDEVSS